MYDAGRHGIAAARDLFENSGAGLKPIGFIDDDPGRQGQLVSGLPVLGRSYDLEPLVAAWTPGGIVVASPQMSSECEERIAAACRRLGIALYRRQVHLKQLIEEPAAARRNAAATPMAERAEVGKASATGHLTSDAALESEPCVRCGGRSVHRSRARGVYERFRTSRTPSRPYRCDDCGWRGWLLPLEHAAPFNAVGGVDLQALDAAFSPTAPAGDSTAASHRV